MVILVSHGLHRFSRMIKNKLYCWNCHELTNEISVCNKNHLYLFIKIRAFAA